MKTAIFLVPAIVLASVMLTDNTTPHAVVSRQGISPAVPVQPAGATPTSIDAANAVASPVTHSAFDPMVTDVLTYTNKAREKKGLKPLVMKEGLNDIARGHSENMASGRVPFSHDGFKDRYSKARQEYTNVYSFGENVSFGPHTGREAVEGWMKSKHHKDNILGDFTSIGIGVAADKKGTWYFTQVFCKD